MEVVSVTGQDSQHFASQETLHLASHDFPASIHPLPHDHPPASENPTPPTPSQRMDSNIRHVDMASSNSFPSMGSPEPPSTQYRTHNREPAQAMFNPQIDGQDHDRMETDEESDDSDSGVDTPQNEETPANEGGDLVMADAEAMDTTPDSLEEGEVQQGTTDLPSQPLVSSTSQPVDPARSPTSNGVIIAPDHPLAAPSDGTLADGAVAFSSNATAVENESGSTHAANMEASAPSNETVTPSEQTSDTAAHQSNPPPTIEAPPSEADPAHQSGENGESESSTEEEEQPYWASFEEDESVPNGDELKQIEQQPSEPDALNHDHWEKLAFESLEDPEYVPSTTGRISWTLKGFHGTPSKPNKEEMMRSPSIFIDGYFWNIKVFPRGNEGSSLMSVYIECSTSPNEGSAENAGAGTTQTAAERPVANEQSATTVIESSEMSDSKTATAPVSIAPTTTQGNENELSQPAPSKDVLKPQQRWEVPAQILCVAYNPEDPRVLAFDRSDHRFIKDSPDWGWRRFHGPWNKLHRRQPMQRQALLRNDTLCFTAYIRTIKDHTGALFWHAPEGQPQWDHFERLGLNRMLTGSMGSSAAVSALSTWLYLHPVSASLKRMQTEYYEEPWRYAKTPLFVELEHCREEFTLSTRESSPDVSFKNSIEMIGWYSYALGDYCDPDAIGFWEALRRVLSFEGSNVKSVGEAKDIFKEILLLKQPDAGKHTRTTAKQLAEPCSVQKTVDLAMSYKDLDVRVWETFDGSQQSPSEHPAVLQVELHRQQYNATARKWQKLTHFIKLDDTISFGLEELASKQGYTLFGIIVHSGSLESKDYCSILRPQGPGTRWIKYAADQAERGVECLTTKQAVTAHEGKKGSKSTSPVAYVATYVRTDLLPELAIKPEEASDKAAGQSEVPKSKESEPMDQDCEEDLLTTVCIYQSDLFEGYDQFGVFDWTQQGAADSRVLKFDINENITPAGLIDAVVEKRKEKFPDREEKYAMWLIDSMLNNNAMEDVLRAPKLIPVTDRTTDEVLKLSNFYYGQCRVWLHVMPPQPEEDRADSQMLDSSTILPAPVDGVTVQNNGNQTTHATGPEYITDAVMQSMVNYSLIPPILSPPPHSSSPPPSAEEIESLSARSTEANRADEPSTEDEPARTVADTITNGDEPARHAVESSSDQHPTSETPVGEGGDTSMEDNGEVEAPAVPTPLVKPTWNSQLDKATLMDLDNVYILLKFFDPEMQSLRGVKCFFTRLTEKVGKILRSKLSLAEDQPIDVYEGDVTTLVRPISLDSRFVSISGTSGSIFTVQRRPSLQELTKLKESGKPATVPEYYEYLLSTADPAYRQPSLTTSYFSTPYYSGSLAYGRPHGHGTSIALSGDAYTGTFASGLKHGHGVMRYARGDTYTGSWINDEPEGQGEMVYAKTGNVYTGGFKKRKRHGKGVMKFEVADEEERLCQICYEEEMDALFFDCGHVAACESCARQVEDCPVCRRRVKAVCKIWMS